MQPTHPWQGASRKGAVIALIFLMALLISAVLVASWTQRGFGNIEISNVRYANYNGIAIRAKLLKPLAASDHPCLWARLRVKPPAPP